MPTQKEPNLPKCLQKAICAFIKSVWSQVRFQKRRIALNLPQIYWVHTTHNQNYEVMALSKLN